MKLSCWREEMVVSKGNKPIVAQPYIKSMAEKRDGLKSVLCNSTIPFTVSFVELYDLQEQAETYFCLLIMLFILLLYVQDQSF